MKPREYSNPHVVMQDVSYTVLQDVKNGSVPRTGMLSIGRVVWLPADGSGALEDAKVRAWAEGIGAIAVSRNSLAKST